MLTVRYLQNKVTFLFSERYLLEPFYVLVTFKASVLIGDLESQHHKKFGIGEMIEKCPDGALKVMKRDSTVMFSQVAHCV